MISLWVWALAHSRQDSEQTRTKEVAKKGEHIDAHGKTVGLEGLAVSNVGKDVLHNRDGPWVADFKVIV